MLLCLLDLSEDCHHVSLLIFINTKGKFLVISNSIVAFANLFKG